MFDIDALNASVRDPACLGRFAQAIHDEGLPFGVIFYDEASGQVLTSVEGGGFERAPAAIWAMVTGEEPRDPGNVNPIASSSIRRHPARMAAHAAETRATMLYAVKYYDPALGSHPWIKDLIDETLTRLQDPAMRRGFAKLATNYERWDMVLEGFLPVANAFCAAHAKS